MKTSYFDRVTSTTPIHKSFDTWEELVSFVGKHRFDYKHKRDVPLFSPAEYRPGSPRLKVNVARVHFGAIDIDGVSDENLDLILERVSGLRFLFYTTWSHASEKPGNSARLFFPLTRPVETVEWSTFWPRLRAYFLNLIDESCSDQSRVFYLPSAPAHMADAAVWYENEGEPFDVDALLRASSLELPISVARVPVTREALSEWVQSLRSGSASDYRTWLRSSLRFLLSGDPLAQEGERDNTIFKLVSAIVQRFPHATAESIAELFADSCVAMGFEHKQVLEKAQRLLDAQEVEQAKEQTQALEQKRAQIRFAFNSNREVPYSADELAAFAKDAGCTEAEFARRWVLQKDNSFWFFVNGSYRGPYTISEIMGVAPLLLAPASSAGVDVNIVTKTGVRVMTGPELAANFGQVVSHVALDMIAQRYSFDQKTSTLIEAPCPRRLIDAEDHPVVAEWLRLLGGPEHNVLLDWIASITRLSEPCSALYLEGSKGAGKTLLAHGLASIWTEHGPTSLEDAFSAFNSTLIGCPVVLADEVMPTDFQGRARTGPLRQFVQARQRTLKRKFLPDSTLRGCIRLVLAANNREMLSSNEQLTVNDIEAIVDRVLHIHVTDEPAMFLQRHRITPDEIASHALWLSQTRKVDSSHRFLVTGSRTDLHRSLTTSSGLRSAVCHWLVAYLHEPHKVDVTKTRLIRKYDGSLYATSRGLIRHWPTYETNQDPPPIGPLSKALSGISIKKRLLKAGDGRPTWFWQVDPENLCAWAEDNGYAERSQVLDLIRQTQAEVNADAAERN
jgi:hypothetical protein